MLLCIKISYDQIYDEHIYMFSLSSIEKIYNIYGFELILMNIQKTHGSMRYILKKINKDNKKSQRLIKLFNIEKKQNINSFKGCLNFLKRKKFKNKANWIKLTKY